MSNSTPKGLFVGTPSDDEGGYAANGMSDVIDATVIEAEVLEASPAGGPGLSGSNPGASPDTKGGWFRKAAKPKHAASAAGPMSGEMAKPSKGLKARKVRKAADSIEALPIQVLMGYLPEVAERDAFEYALGLAEKYLIQDGMSFFLVTKFANGYVYEVHEGGPGKAYAPEIVKYFLSVGPFNSKEPEVVRLATAQRLVEITRERDGLSAVLLPESATEEPTEWLKAKRPMRAGVPRRKGMLFAGIALLVTGTLAASFTGVFFRLQGYAPPSAQPVERISAQELPLKQWDKLSQLLHVKALRYQNGAWQEPEIYTENDLKAQVEEAGAPTGAAAPELPPAGDQP